MQENISCNGTLQNTLIPSLQKSFSPLPEAGDRLLLFLASAAHEDNCLTHHSWQTASQVLHDIFTDGTSSFSVFQSKFHAALLQPPLPSAAFINDTSLAKSFSALPHEAQKHFRKTVRSLSFEYSHVLDELLKKNGVSAPVLEDEGKKDDQDNTVTYMENGIASRHDLPAASSHVQKQLTAAAKNLFSDETALPQLQGLDLCHITYGRNKRQCTPMQKTVMDAREAALVLDSAELYLHCEDALRLMRDQPFSFAVLGEVKKGKSSLVNALLGKDISPVREAMATTSAAINFRWGKTFRYKITYAGKTEPDVPDTFREIAFNSLYAESSVTDHWTLSENRFADIILNNDCNDSCAAVIDVELPSPLLKKGIVLTDTPGLNFPSSLQRSLALHAGFNADCVIVVMDAEMPHSAAAAECLQSISRKGRASYVIGVVTNMDRLTEQTSRSNAMKSAQDMMAEAASAGLKPMGLFTIHAGLAMKNQCSGSGLREDAAFAKLLDAINSLSGDKASLNSSLSRRLVQRSQDFAGLAERESEKFLQRELAALPDAQHIAFLKQHKEQLHKVFEQTIAQAQSVISSADIDIETWQKAQLQELDEWEETAVLKIMDAIRKHADILGSPEMFSQKNWEEFDKTALPVLAESTVQDILCKRNESLRSWNQKLRSFDGALKEISTCCLDAVMVEEKKLAAAGGFSETHAQILVRANNLVKNLGLVGSGTMLGSLGSAGFGIGVVLAGIGWWALLPVAFASGVYALLRHFGNPERCRKIFFNKREEAVRSWAAKQKARLKDFFEKTLEEIVAAYRQAAEKSFLPAASMLAEEEASLSLYLSIMDKIRIDAEKKASSAASLAGRLAKEIEYNKR